MTPYSRSATWREGRKLSVMLNINQFGQYATLFPSYNAMDQLNSIGTSNYNALQTTLRLRAWHGLSTQFAYTWAHALDEITAYRGVIPLDSTNLKAEYGNGDFDTRHNFSAVFTWDIPGSSHGPRWLTHGWALNSLMTFHTGQPLDQVRPGLNVIADPFAGWTILSKKLRPSQASTGLTRQRSARRRRLACRTYLAMTCAATSTMDLVSPMSTCQFSRIFRSRSGSTPNCGRRCLT